MQTDTQTAPAQTGPDTSESDYDRYWEEFTQEKAQDAPDSEEQDTDQAAESGQEAFQGAEADPQSGASEPRQDDIWANATPEQREAFNETSRQLRAQQEALERLRNNAASSQQLRSVEGRIDALTNRLEGMMGQMQGGREQPSSNQAQRNGKAASEKDSGFGEDWQKLREEYPEILGPVEQQFQAQNEQLRALSDQTRKFEEKFAGLDRAQQDAFMHGQEQRLAEKHPDWDQVTASDAFYRWYEQAPEPVRAAVEQNGQGIVNADNAAFVLDLFKQQQPQGQSQQQAASQETPQQTSQSSASQQAGQDDTSARRRRRLDSAPSVGGKGPGAGAGAPDDYDAAFDHFAAKMERDRRR